MAGVLSQMRSQLSSIGVSGGGGGSKAALAAAVASNDAALRALRPWDYELPAWAQALQRLIAFMRSNSREAQELKRKLLLLLALVAGGGYAARVYLAHRARMQKRAALALRAREAAKAGGPLLNLSPSSGGRGGSAEDDRKEESFGDRLLHPPEDLSLLPVAGRDKGSVSNSSAVLTAAGEQPKNVKQRVAVDALFFARLRKILKITIPSVYSTEFAYLSILTALLFARTFFSIAIAELVGVNAQSLVSRKWGKMWRGVQAFALITIPASAVNAGLKYSQEMVALRFRKRLSEHVHEQYLDGTNFYKACNLGGDARIDNADQRVTADIKDFSDEIAALYANMLKPGLDVVLFTIKLGSLLGWQGPAAMHAYFLFSAIVKRHVMPNLGRLVARESELEGFYRTAHNRLITNSEEIAFYDGSRKEKVIINNSLQLICEHIAYARKVKAWVAVFDGLLVKYYASIAGYSTLLSPFILGLNTDQSTADLTRDYIRNSSYLGQLSTAVAALVMVGNKLTSIAGYTSRVSELLEQVKHLNEAGNEPFEIKPEIPHVRELVEEGSAYTAFVAEWRARCDQQQQARFDIRHAKATPSLRRNNSLLLTAASGSGADEQLHPLGGRIEVAEDIEFEGVDIVSPEGKLLVHDLNFKVECGTNVMITGPNGVGKSSLFRIIGELWPLHSGVLKKPQKEDILFVPQKPYLVLGTLRDQIIYPHEKADMDRLGVTDDDLAKLLAIVDPARIITTEWNFDVVKDWFHAFSGGQKQRVAMARLFYHRPRFAILDECTSAVSDEVEGTIYSTCRLLGITIFTVSHRPQLAKYHDVVLRFEGETRWSTTKIDSRKEIAREQAEKAALAASTGSKTPALALLKEGGKQDEFKPSASRNATQEESKKPELAVAAASADAAASEDAPADEADGAAADGTAAATADDAQSSQQGQGQQPSRKQRKGKGKH